MKSAECALLMCLGLLFVTHLLVLGDATHGGPGGALVAMETDNDDDSDSDDDSSVTVEDDLGYDPNMALFEPTNEWKSVKPGQAIPPGLHVRLNLQTGEREARLMETSDDGKDDTDTSESELTVEQRRLQAMKEAIEETMAEMEAGQGSDADNEFKYWKDGDGEGMRNTHKRDFTPQELKEALKKFKYEKDDVQDEKLREEALKKKFRTMEELKAEFAEMELTMKTDVEVLTGLLDTYRDAELGVEERRQILEELEYHVHQIDTAQNLALMGGLDLVIKDLNHSAEVIRSEAAMVVGSAVQSNPKVQIAAVEAGCLQQLIRMLSTESSTPVRSRVLYSLSSLLRNFPYAQHRFLQLGGMQALTNLFTRPDLHKLQVKAVTLVNDLVMEKIIAEDSKSDPIQQQKLEQYKQIPLTESVTEQGWCELLPSLLLLDDHDSREKVLRAMTTLLSPCRAQFATLRPSMSSLHRLQREYTALAREEMEEEGTGDVGTYFSGLLNTVNAMIESLDVKKDEL